MLRKPRGTTTFVHKGSGRAPNESINTALKGISATPRKNDRQRNPGGRLTPRSKTVAEGSRFEKGINPDLGLGMGAPVPVVAVLCRGVVIPKGA
ncbi:hypothetical protein JTB14_026036 [Gonioctena quinquepunctata]|nr:hypothetical protein JTB14_026036 [Gonioctena quinquepunctata]